MANKREAISHAAYTVLRTFAAQRGLPRAEWMQVLGYAPNASTAPAKLGRSAALAVLAARSQDGANAADNFTDTTGYAPHAPGRQTPGNRLTISVNAQLPTTPQWGRVDPFD